VCDSDFISGGPISASGFLTTTTTGILMKKRHIAAEICLIGVTEYTTKTLTIFLTTTLTTVTTN
jgi:hypothetical protein